MNKDYAEGKEAKKYEMSIPSKKIAYDLIKDLNEMIQADEPDFYRIGNYIADLQRFFRPKDTPKTIAKDDVKWCLQAASPEKDNRKPIQTAYIDPERHELAACDGRRLHLIKNYTSHDSGGILPDGKHIEEAERADSFGTFPNYPQVIPAAKTERVFDWSIGPDMKGATRQAEIDEDIITIKEKYYKEAVAGMIEPKFYCDDYLNPILITDEQTNRLAIIMPIRTK